jgi:hypothetical protein
MYLVCTGGNHTTVEMPPNPNYVCTKETTRTRTWSNDYQYSKHFYTQTGRRAACLFWGAIL